MAAALCTLRIWMILKVKEIGIRKVITGWLALAKK